MNFDAGFADMAYCKQPNITHFISLSQILILAIILISIATNTEWNENLDLLL